MPGEAEKQFMALRLGERLLQLQQKGEYLDSRRHGGHNVHLYRMDGFLCEAWMRIGHDQVQWIEIPRDPEILAEYVKLDRGDLPG